MSSSSLSAGGNDGGDADSRDDRNTSGLMGDADAVDDDDNYGEGGGYDDDDVGDTTDTDTCGGMSLAEFSLGSLGELSRIERA